MIVSEKTKNSRIESLIGPVSEVRNATAIPLRMAQEWL
jgi:hypothetical protein